MFILGPVIQKNVGHLLGQFLWSLVKVLWSDSYSKLDRGPYSGLNPFGHGWVFRPIFQSALRGGKTIFFSLGHPQLKVLKGKEFSGMSCLKIF